MDQVRQDVVYALRRLRRGPGFAVVAVLTLALGIGANSAIFSVVNGVLLEPLPFDRPDRLVGLFGEWKGDRVIMSPPNFLDVRRHARTLQSAAAYDDNGFTLTGAGEPVRLDGTEVSASFFDVLRVAPAIGRVFAPEENRPGRTRVVVLSHALWSQRFGGDPSVVGRAIALDAEKYEVIGVMPPGFSFPEARDLWIPIEEDKAFSDTNRGAWYLNVVARLTDGVTLEQARAEMATIGRQLEQAHPRDNTGVSVTLAPLHEDLVEDVRPALLILLGAVGLVLLIVALVASYAPTRRATAIDPMLALRAE